MQRRIHLHGSLKSIHPEPIVVNTATIAEAMKMLTTQLPGFRPDPVKGYRRIRVVGHESLESLLAVNTTSAEIHVYPQLNGGKQGGFLQILLGAALIAASFIPGVGTVLAPILFNLGAAMLLGGVLAFFNTPKTDKKDGAQNKSYYLGAPKNTVAIGTRIPILYGRRLVGGHYISFDISSLATTAAG
jgi:predicted phage tail protein